MYNIIVHNIHVHVKVRINWWPQWRLISSPERPGDFEWDNPLSNKFSRHYGHQLILTFICMCVHIHVPHVYVAVWYEGQD